MNENDNNVYFNNTFYNIIVIEGVTSRYSKKIIIIKNKYI